MVIHKIYARGFGANTYAITEDNETAIVIDPSQPRVADELKKMGLTVKVVLLTHCHFDHVGGVPALQAQGAKVFCSTEERPLIGTHADLFDRFGAPRTGYTVDGTLHDHEEREFCGVTVKTLFTPGHTKGSVCYLMTAKDGSKYLFSGDTLFSGSIGRTDFPTGNIGQMRESLALLATLDDMPVYAGHEEDTTLAREKRSNPFMTDL